MSAHPIGNRVDARLVAQVDRDAAERLAIVQPARVAAARQTAVRDSDIG
jgi:hypothetical protein